MVIEAHETVMVQPLKAGRKRILTSEQVEKAKELRAQGYKREQLAIIFNVGRTTIWENVYAKARRIKKEREAKFRHLDTLLEIIFRLKQEGYNTLYVAKKLDIPLAEVNYIYGHFQ